MTPAGRSVTQRAGRRVRPANPHRVTLGVKAGPDPKISMRIRDAQTVAASMARSP
jgi:hypothetical protein